MFGLHEPLHGRSMSSKHLKDEPLLSHPPHHQIHPISVRNWMQSSIADQPVKSVYNVRLKSYTFYVPSQLLYMF